MRPDEWPKLSLEEKQALRKLLRAVAYTNDRPAEPARQTHDHRGRALIDISNAPSAMEERMKACKR